VLTNASSLGENEPAASSARPEASLYRFRPTSDLKSGYIEQVLLDSLLYAALPTTFNDPFDCQVRFDPKGKPQLWRSYIKRMLRIAGRKSKDADRGATVLMADRAGLARRFQESIDGVGVVCLCESPTIPLLWSHYSDGHRGLCFGFAPVPGSIFRETHPVRYSRDCPLIRPDASDEENVSATLLTKAIEWEYELEHRIVFYESGPGLKAFPPVALREVVFGCRASDEFVAAVKSIAARRATPVELLRATPDPLQYRLEIVTCPK